MRRDAPGFAIALMDHFGVTASNEALAGDLLEEFHSGRSRLWFWRQALVATAGFVGREILSHKLLALQAVFTGVVLILALTQLQRRAADAGWGDGQVAFWVLTCAAFALAGWSIGARYPKHRAAMVTAFAAYALVAKAVMLALNYGQLVSASQPLRPLGIVALTVVSVLCVLVGGLGWPRRRSEAG